MSLIGIPVGIYGYLFPSNINIMVMELYASKRYQLLIFLLGLILVFETIYCIAALSFLNVLKNNHKLYSSIELVAYVLIFVMGFWMMAEKKNDNKITQRNIVFRGIFNIIIHPKASTVVDALMYPLRTGGKNRHRHKNVLWLNSLWKM